MGILAHVDAGKTTLSEGMLFASGAISKLGRVDRGDAFLDSHELERERGITIFSSQAMFKTEKVAITLIDTPGHIDFSCEAERALSVQDYAVLIISATDGIGAHTKTLWSLLSSRRIPTFIFVNKMDLSDRNQRQIMEEIRCVLTPCATNFMDEGEKFYEEIASLDAGLMEEFFAKDSLSVESIASSVAKRRVFPVYFGSALKMQGVRELLSGIDKYTVAKNYSETVFGAKVYKIARDRQGKRLTYLKVTGGSLKTKDTVSINTGRLTSVTEKIEEIRLYSGDKYKTTDKVSAGEVCAVLGLTATKPGMGLGSAKTETQTLSPVLDYRIILPKEANPYETYMRLMALAEEDPSLALDYDSRIGEIRVRLMGEIQIQVLKRVIRERFGIEVSFDEGSILYKETISDTVYGAGHFEPLRHYAELHIRMEPLPEGSGIITDTECDTDRLSLNWQRLILTHLEERVHRGVLTGSPLTDVKITLTAGKAHLKHTDGGDFRQATYRAVRQGLMKGESILLEPSFDFTLEIPTEYLGRAMNDITNMKGSCSPPEITENTATLRGNCPVYTMRSYASEVRAYTRGEGRLALTAGPYMPAHNAEEVIAKRGYNPDLDERNPAGSVFCKGGAGYAVPWYEADALMHITDTGAPREKSDTEEVLPKIAKKQDYHGTAEEDKELMRIFESTYGKIKPRSVQQKVENKAPAEKKVRPAKPRPKGDEYVIIDGYNFLFAIDEYRKIAENDISRARDVLVRLMCDYSAFRKCKVIVAFDAYKRKGGEGSAEECGDVTVVYTKESQTADAFIERTTYEISSEHTVRVVTSDFTEQLVVLGNGGLRVSAREFDLEIKETLKLIRETIDSYVK